ncbi:hypothetical protein ACWC94_40925, partial [Streptomyces sp. NPDC001135]
MTSCPAVRPPGGADRSCATGATGSAGAAAAGGATGLSDYVLRLLAKDPALRPTAEQAADWLAACH